MKTDKKRGESLSFLMVIGVQIGVYHSKDRCYFLVSEQESNQRSRPGRGITCKSHPRPGPHSRRFSHRPLKMSRFSAGSAMQTCRFATCKRSKIGTFLNAGWRCGGGYLRGRDLPVAPLRSASFGPFLAETRKGHKRCQFAKLKFEILINLCVCFRDRLPLRHPGRLPGPWCHCCPEE